VKNASPAAAVATPVTSFGDATLSLRARVLLVDDDRLVRTALPAELAEFHVEVAPDLASAAACIKRGQPFDLFLFDADLGDGTSGFDLLELLRACGREAPAALLVGSTDEGEQVAQRALAAGFVDLVDKSADRPDGGRALARRLMGHVERQRRQRERAGEQRQLVRRDEWHLALADLLDDAIVEFDAEARVLAANAAACRMSGLQRESLVGRACSDVLPGHRCDDQDPSRCPIRRALATGQRVEWHAVRDGRTYQAVATRHDRGGAPCVVWREMDVTTVRHLEQQLEESLHSLEAAHWGLQQQADQLERVLRASTEFKDAAEREELADRVLMVLADLPGFSLVAIGLQDDDRKTTSIGGVACMAGGRRLPLGRRTVMLDLLNLSPDRKRVSNSYVVEGWSISVRGPKEPRTRTGEACWDLGELFDGTAVALTPLRASGRPHGFLLVKAETQRRGLDASQLHVVEILANLAAVAFDNLRMAEAEKRRARWSLMVSRLGRGLMGVHAPEVVLQLAVEALRGVLEGATIAYRSVRVGGGGTRTVHGGPFERPLVLKEPEEPAGGLLLAPPAAQLLIPVRVGERSGALIAATAASRTAFDDLDHAALEAFREVVAKAHANASAFVEEQRSLARLRLVAEVGRIASGSLETDEVLGRALEHLCQHGAYEMAVVSLVDRERRKLVITAQASRRGARPIDGFSAPLLRGVPGAVVASGEAVLVPDVRRQEHPASIDACARAELCVPLRVLDDVIGILDVGSTEVAAFDEGDLVAIQAVGDHLARAFHNARLFQQVKQKNRELRESEKNKTEFLSVVAHDLRTPLTSIRSAADLVLMYRDEPPEVTDEFLAAIRDEAARLGRLVDDFLAYARLEAGILDYEVGALELREVLEHFARVFEGPAAQKRIQLACELPPVIPIVLADRQRVAQVVANLLSNATKYTPAGGRITLSCTALPVEPGQVLGRVRVDVADTGPGIEECHRERVFSKFVRLEPSPDVRGGAGLGLPIAREIVEHLGGTLWFDSRPGGGTTFRFTLPALVGQPCAVA
jgi:PAS domain S-box-containing protein